jgi:hypothetical protein
VLLQLPSRQSCSCHLLLLLCHLWLLLHLDMNLPMYCPNFQLELQCLQPLLL